MPSRFFMQIWITQKVFIWLSPNSNQKYKMATVHNEEKKPNKRGMYGYCYKFL